MRLNITLQFIAVFLLLLSSTLHAKSNAQGENCLLGAFPFLIAQRLEKIFAPIAAELSTVINCSIRFQSSVNFETFMIQLEKQKFGIAFIQPFDYVRIAAKNGYVPLVTYQEKLHAVLVTLPESNINTISDLKGKTIAMPPLVGAVSFLGKIMLKQANIDPLTDVTILHTKNHGSCIQKVLIGKADACTTAPPPLRLFHKTNNRQLKQIAVSPPIPHALFVIRDNVNEDLKKRLQQKMLTMKLNAEALRLFTRVPNKSPFRITTDGEYDTIRQLLQHIE